MNKRRLLKLADLLEADASEKKGIKFDMGTIAERKAKSAEDRAIKLDCGTTGCAMGLAGISGAFKHAGLGYRIGEQLDPDGGMDIVLTVGGSRTDYHSAAIMIFGLTQGQARFLFAPESYPSKFIRGAKAERYVAKRIRDLVAGEITSESW